MRLLHTKDLYLQEFPCSPPKYAILSHRWSDGEISFEDYSVVQTGYPPLPPDRSSKITQRSGYRKILACCAFALARGHEWVWVDTVCIDKRSSAELSEAINSMWKWYAGADECIVYLFDVEATSLASEPVTEQFRKSEWFKRSWTLQELLAPSRLVFCTRRWEIFRWLGKLRNLPHSTRAEREQHVDTRLRKLAMELQGITRIPWQIHARVDDPEESSVAARMSWAADREATRQEDVAYSLLGLFDINMPLLYGEGRKAFTRLQKEIIEKSDDESIFAWQCCGWHGDTSEDECKPISACSGNLLADSPHFFRLSGEIVSLGWRHRQPYHVTHQGLELVSMADKVELEKLLSNEYFQSYSHWYYIVKLNCRDCHGQPCTIVLRDLNTKALQRRALPVKDEQADATHVRCFRACPNELVDGINGENSTASRLGQREFCFLIRL